MIKPRTVITSFIWGMAIYASLVLPVKYEVVESKAGKIRHIQHLEDRIRFTADDSDTLTVPYGGYEQMFRKLRSGDDFRLRIDAGKSAPGILLEYIFDTRFEYLENDYKIQIEFSRSKSVFT